MNGNNSISTTIKLSLTFVIYMVSEKIATIEFLPYTMGQPNTDHCILTFFMRVKNLYGWSEMKHDSLHKEQCCSIPTSWAAMSASMSWCFFSRLVTEARSLPWSSVLSICSTCQPSTEHLHHWHVNMLRYVFTDHGQLQGRPSLHEHGLSSGFLSYQDLQRKDSTHFTKDLSLQALNTSMPLSQGEKISTILPCRNDHRKSFFCCCPQCTHTHNDPSPDHHPKTVFLPKKAKFFTYLFFLLAHFHFKCSVCLFAWQGGSSSKMCTLSSVIWLKKDIRI